MYCAHKAPNAVNLFLYCAIRRIYRGFCKGLAELLRVVIIGPLGNLKALRDVYGYDFVFGLRWIYIDGIVPSNEPSDMGNW